MQDGKKLHTLLFKTESSERVIFYLHRNAGSLDGWGSVAETFTDFNYDTFIPDNRGYGKNEGSIHSKVVFQTNSRYLPEKYIKRIPFRSSTSGIS